MAAIFFEGVKSPRASVGSQSPLKIFGLGQLKRHCSVKIDNYNNFNKAQGCVD